MEEQHRMPDGSMMAGAEHPGSEAPDGQQMQPGAENQASPEEQAQYDQFVGRAMELIYNPQMFPRVVEMLRGGGEEGEGAEQTGASGPEQGLANTTAMVITRVHKASGEAGANISPDVLFHGGSEVFMQLAEVSDKAGITDYANDRDKLEAAYFLAIDVTTQQMQADGSIDQEGAKAAMQKLVDMDANGELEQIFHGLNEKDKAAREDPANDNDPMMKGGMAPKGMQ